MKTAQLRIIRRWQIALVAGGVLFLALGGLTLLMDVSPANYFGIVLWFAGAIIVHDGIIAPLTFAVALVLRRIGRRMPLAVVLITQGALVVGAVISLIVFPEMYKKSLGDRKSVV